MSTNVSHNVYELEIQTLC